MGQVPPKYFLPSAPYGSSDAANTLNRTNPAAVNPQTPLLPPNFTNPATQASPAPPANPLTGGGGNLGGFFGGGRNMFR